MRIGKRLIHRRSHLGVLSSLLAGSLHGSGVMSMSSSLSDSQPSSSFDSLLPRIDYSFVRELNADPEQEKNAPNKIAREVNSGHYVRVAPTPLRSPYLIVASADMLSTLGLDASAADDARFTRTFSGDLAAGAGALVADVAGSNETAKNAMAGKGRAVGFETRGWATPYALSIYGTPQTPNGAGRRGYGYGDGRAISIGEVITVGGGTTVDATRPLPLPVPLPVPRPRLPPRMELQLKGGGTTPFCRGADGAAILRSSVREFIASEAMHALGVSTTRALCLIASGEEAIVRPWYSNASTGGQKHGGDIMLTNRRAITTRVARSFIRVGQFELFGRRAARGEAEGLAELELLARHTLAREYPKHEPVAAGDPLQPALLGMLREASTRFAALASSWLRVGYVQSNFNSDNCLVGGVTMDYGPFGFLEKYDPSWAMWVGAGDHFSYANQPNAAAANFAMLLQSLLPLFDEAGVAEAETIFKEHRKHSLQAVATVWANKMGFGSSRAAVVASALHWTALEALLKAHPTDFIIIFRQLIPALAAPSVDEALTALTPAFYAPLPAAHADAWRAWLTAWRAALGADGGGAADVMHASNPRYVPREWLLVEAYVAAEMGDHAPLLTLHRVLQRPYDEQPDAPAHYYARAPSSGQDKGGIAFMS